MKLSLDGKATSCNAEGLRQCSHTGNADGLMTPKGDVSCLNAMSVRCLYCDVYTESAQSIPRINQQANLMVPLQPTIVQLQVLT